MGLISEIVEGHPLPDRDLVFRHQSFQEYLASLELKKRLFSQNKLNKEALLNHLEYNTWDDVLFFLIGSLENRLAREIILLTYQYDSILAGKCIAPYKGNKDEDFREAINRLFSLLKNKDVRRARAAADALGKIGSERAVDRLISLLSNEDYGVPRAADALGNISKKFKENDLFKLVEDLHNKKHNNAVNSLKHVHQRRFLKILYPESFLIIK